MWAFVAFRERCAGTSRICIIILNFIAFIVREREQREHMLYRDGQYQNVLTRVLRTNILNSRTMYLNISLYAPWEISYNVMIELYYFILLI